MTQHASEGHRGIAGRMLSTNAKSWSVTGVLLVAILTAVLPSSAASAQIYSTRLFDNMCFFSLEPPQNTTCDTVTGCTNWSTSVDQAFQCSYGSRSLNINLVMGIEAYMEGSSSLPYARFCYASSANTSTSCGAPVSHGGNWFAWKLAPRPVNGTFNNTDHVISLFVTLPRVPGNGDLAKFKSYRLIMN